LLLAPALRAADGIVEINQSVALTGGLNGDLLADPPGFPVVIREPGVYRLTSDLEIASSNVNAIVVQTLAPYLGSVAIDLNGFSIRGPNRCSVVASIVDCTANGSGSGIAVSVVSLAGRVFPAVTVRNGTVRGAGNEGLSLPGDDSRAIDVRVLENGGAGIRLGAGGRASNCLVGLNRFEGIRAGAGSSIEGCVVERNGSNGVFGLGELDVTESVVLGNRSSGVVATGTGSRVSAVQANGNRFNGIASGDDASAIGNGVDANGAAGIVGGPRATFALNAVNRSGGAGISLTSGTVAGNAIVGSQACGIQAGPNPTGLSGNVAIANDPSGAQCGFAPGSEQISGGTTIGCNYVECAVAGTYTIRCPGGVSPPCF
jgi:hypothetical protein